MATVRDGDKAVLLVIDVQVGVMKAAWDAPRVIRNVARAVERARGAGVPVVWVQHADDQLALGSPAWRWVPELVPAIGEALIPKQFNSSFEKTTLEEELARLGASRVVLAGAASNWCIRATAYGALDRGYDVTLIEDAHTTESLELDDGVTIAAEAVVNELNLAMKWLTYPGRNSGTATAEAVDFAPNAGRAEAPETSDPLALWHRIARARDASGLALLLADDVVFHSPVVHTPQRGKPIVTQYLAAALRVFGNESFRYVRELRGEHDAVLEFELELDSTRINGVDMLRWDDEGRVVEFKVMLRPLKAVNLIHQKMAAMLQGG